MIRGHKVVTAVEMQRIEKLAEGAGFDMAVCMDRAGEGVAKVVEEFVYEQNLSKQVLLLLGKGNKAGDAYTAGAVLLERGFFVKAMQAFPIEECSPLCQDRYQKFLQLGGVVGASVEECSVIIDGLLGTGFHGKADGKMGAMIEGANNSGLPIFSIDIPSGVNGSTGEVASVAISAAKTIYLGLPKLGFFIGKGWDYVGELVHVDIELPSDHAHPDALLLDPKTLKFPHGRRSQHKYERGYVLGIGGSLPMPGAAALSCAGVLRSGAGIVRLFSMKEMPTHHLLAEVIHEEIDLKRILEESKRAAAFFVGPGLGRTKEAEKLFSELLPLIQKPSVLDADALFFLAKNPSWKIPAHAILTPHHGEMKALLQKEVTWKECQAYVEHHVVTLVLKGAPTVIFTPGKKPLIIAEGDPAMATAGSGDVLTGIIAGLLAQKLTPEEAAALGVHLHAKAGELAASTLGTSMIASDILSFLPDVFHS